MDQAGHFTAAEGATATATYDANGLRATRTPVGGVALHFAWDTHGAVPLMLTDGTTNFVHDTWKSSDASPSPPTTDTLNGARFNSSLPRA